MAATRIYKKIKVVSLIKDTWTKSKGRVEVGEGGGFSWGGVEGWREKAYNCNCITIKIFLKSGEFGCHHSEETTKGANGPR